MLTNNFFRVTSEFTVPSASNPVVMVWDFRVLSTDNPLILTLHGEELADSFVERYYNPLAAQISDQVSMSKISIRAWEFPTDGYDSVTTLFEGSNPNKIMPPANTLAIRLVRTNFAMRNGRKAFPGGCVDQVSLTGGMLAGTVTAFGTVTGAWASTDWVPEITGVDCVLGEAIIRVPTAADTDPTVFSLNISYGSVYWGTQNSRK